MRFLFSDTASFWLRCEGANQAHLRRQVAILKGQSELARRIGRNPNADVQAFDQQIVNLCKSIVLSFSFRTNIFQVPYSDKLVERLLVKEVGGEDGERDERDDRTSCILKF